MYKYRYARHFTRYEEDFSSVDEAAIRAWADFDCGTSAALGLFDEDGKMVMDWEALYNRGDELCENGRGIKNED